MITKEKIDGITIYTTQLGEKFRIVQIDYNVYVIQKQVSRIESKLSWFRPITKYYWVVLRRPRGYKNPNCSTQPHIIYRVEETDIKEDCETHQEVRNIDDYLIEKDIDKCEKWIEGYSDYTFNEIRSERLRRIEKELKAKLFPIYH